MVWCKGIFMKKFAKRIRFFLISALLVWCVATFVGNAYKIHIAKQRIAEIDERIAEYNQKTDEIISEKKYMGNQKYIEKKARNTEDLIYPNEIIYVLSK